MADSQIHASSERPRKATVIGLTKQLLPPLLLLPLFFLPFEVFTALYWLAGGVALCGSMMTLVRIAWAHVRRRRPDWFIALRPGLTVLFFGTAAATMSLTTAALTRDADQLGRMVASEMQAVCTKQGKCVAAPPGSDWEIIDSDRAIKRLKFMSVEYRTNSAGSEFTVRVRHRTEDELRIHGGVAAALREEVVLR
jgi:hypothetical protein